MVPFNVLRMGQGRFHQGTSGELTTAADLPPAIVEAFAGAGLPFHEAPDIEAVLWGKLVINLNNALNALADLPLKQQLEDPVWRKVMSRAIAEGLAVFDAAGIRPKTFLPVPPWMVVHLLRLPTWLFTRVARKMVDVDPTARSSMWEDLQKGRQTEVRLLNGEIVALGQTHGVPTPVNSRIVQAIEAAERGERDPAATEALRACA